MNNEQWSQLEKDYMPWRSTTPEQKQEQAEWQKELRERYDIQFGKDCFVSKRALVFPNSIIMGDNSFIAAGAIVRNTALVMGAHCTVNSYAIIFGKVTMGDGVRIASNASIMGMNHGFSDPDLPIYRQPNTYKGITIGDDVWIGAGALIVDGVTIGSHSIVAAGAVLTKEVPAGSIVGGNPARVIRNRPGYAESAAASQVSVADSFSIKSGNQTLPEFPIEQEQESREPFTRTLNQKNRRELTVRLQAFGAKVKDQLPGLLQHYLVDAEDGPAYINQPGSKRTVRAWCDVVEIAAMFDTLPPGLSREQWIVKLQSFQDSETGLLPDLWNPIDPNDNKPELLSDPLSRYHILAVGYALETLGATFVHPIHVVENLTIERLYEKLDTLPWKTNAWSSGDWIDCYATGLYFNRKYFKSNRTPDPLFGWLLTHADTYSGMWGSPTPEQKWLLSVNGFYRLTRATYAQFGIPVPYPQAVIDTVLAHSKNPQFFRDDVGTACNVLDVIHPLWLCTKQTDYRRVEIEEWAERQIERVLAKWVDGEGFSFPLEQSERPGLKGTEMWLSILYLLADACSISNHLPYSPRGVHRLEVALPIQSAL